MGITMAALPLPYTYTSLSQSQQKLLKIKLNCKTKTYLLIQCFHNQNNVNGHAAKFPEKNPPRPRRIILVRHGESEANVDESVYARVPDPKIGLTDKGKAQAEECGQRIKTMIEKDGDINWQLYFYVSPYRRTLETLQSLARPFERSRIAGFREEPRIREQDWGFRETLRADINIGRYQQPGEKKTDVNLVIVSHGLTHRVFLMRWYKWTVQQFEGLYNFHNGGMLVMEKGYGGRYSLLMHHQEQELRQFGLTDEMLIDQEWQKYAKPADLNHDCPMVNSFFPHLNEAVNQPQGSSSLNF